MEINWAFATHEGEERLLVGKLVEKRHFEDLDIVWKTILTFILLTWRIE
jgi:hypothetical protein